MSLLQDRILVTISAASEGAVRELQDLEKSAKGGDDAVLNLGKSLKTGLVAGAAALAGTGLVSFLNDSVQGLVEAQDAARAWAQSTNSSIEAAGKFTTVLRGFGIEQQDLLEINAEFSKKIEEQPELLDNLGVSVARTEGGVVDMNQTLVDTITALEGVDDGVKQTQLLIELFGEEGGKQLARLVQSGVALEDALEQVGFKDRAREIQDYQNAMRDLGYATDEAQQIIGAALVPVLTAAAEATADVVRFLGEVPGEVYLVVGAAVALQVALSKGLVAKGFDVLLVSLLNVGAGLLDARTGFQNLGTAIGNMVGKINPTTAVLAGVVAWYTALSFAAEDAKKRVEEFLPEYLDLVDAFGETEGLSRSVRELEESASIWSSIGASFKGIDPQELLLGPLLPIKVLADAFRDGGNDAQYYEEQLQKIREEQGEMAVATADAAYQQRELGDLIAQGITSGDEFAAALADAGESAQEAARTQEILNGVLAAYNAITDGAIEATEDFYSAFYTAQEAVDALKASVAAYNEEPTENNLDDLVQDTRKAADAAVAQWEAAQLRLGNFVTESEIAAQRVAQIEILLQTPDFPEGAAEQLRIEAASIVAAAAREADYKIPVGMTTEDVDTALANIAAALADPELDPDLQAQLELDQTSLQTVKNNIANLGVDAATEVKVDADTASAEAAIGEVAQDTSSTHTVNTSFEPGGYTAVKARKDYLAEAIDTDLAIDVAFGPGGYNAVKDRKDYLTQNRTAYIDVVVRGASAAREQLASLDAVAVVGSASAPAPVVNNSVRVDLDGFQLRSVVREEVRFASTAAGGLP